MYDHKVTYYEYEGYGQFGVTTYSSDGGDGSGTQGVSGLGDSSGLGGMEYVGSAMGHGKPAHTVTDYDLRTSGYNQMRKARDPYKPNYTSPATNSNIEHAKELFPVVGWVAYIDKYNALNMCIKETISLSIYDYEHIIGFDDKISFRGVEYFLESNTVHKDTSVLNQQTISAVRWIF